MGKLITMALIIFFSFLFFLHANGRIITQSNTINNLLHEDGPEEVRKWYNELSDKTLITKELNFFFFADSLSDQRNQVKVAQNLSAINPPFFGMVQAFDYPLTAEFNQNSKSLGYAQGFFLESSQQEFSAMLGVNLLLTEFSNCTLTLLGQDPFNHKYRELSVVGGTGVFRLATGNAIMYNHYHVGGFAIVELTIFLRYYAAPSPPLAPSPSHSNIKQVA